MDKGLLNDATSSDDSPTPGYMFGEISRATIANYQACVDLISYLTNRLQKNNHNIKYKCLVIIKHVCRTGRSDFKKDMARNLEPVKECLQFKGPPDPLRGDEIYKRVREAATEALEAIFDSTQPVTTSAVANRIESYSGGYANDTAQRNTTSNYLSSSEKTMFGFGSDSNGTYTGHPGAEGNFGGPPRANIAQGQSSMNRPSNTSMGSTTGSAYGGIGNPNFKDPREEVSFMQRMSALAGDVSAAAASTSSASTSEYSSGSDYQFRSNRSGGPGVMSMASSKPPPAFEAPLPPLENAQRIVPDMPVSKAGFGRAGSAAKDGEYETSMIAGLCEPGGMKAVPPADKLESFLNVASTLSPDMVGSGLLDMFNSDSYQSRVKALIVVHDLCKTRGCQDHVQFWKAHADDIKCMQEDSKASVRTQAQKLLRSLQLDTGGANQTTENYGGNVEERVESSSKQSRIQQAVPVSAPVSLIDFADESSSQARYQPQTQQVNLSEFYSSSPSVSAPQANVDGMFSGMSLTNGPATAPVAAPTNNISNPNVDNNTSVFSFLNSSTNSQQPPAAAAVAPTYTAPTTTSSNSSVFDFLSDNSAPIAPTVPAKSTAFNIADFDPLMQPKTPQNPSYPPNQHNNNGVAYQPNIMQMPSTQQPQYSNQQLPYGNQLNLSVPLPAHMVPPQSYPMSMPVQQGYGPSNTYQAQPGYASSMPPAAPAYRPYQPNVMGSVTKERVVIPDSTGGGNTGFSFMEPKKNQGDSFNFVADAMKNSTNRK